ncbi:Dynamin family protein [Stieleria neptunia]|uniref:Dynamin family protein n=1 Tax=Stieleria neptunia TaxID=2527979 RepID=A0A518HRD7_9BACT|nr:dynamin family protein [Stieleria neptunia]QDV43405.1 Dynamin family protein [Stieleria neptunia]
MADKILDYLERHPLALTREISNGIREDFSTVDRLLYGPLAGRVAKNDDNEWYCLSDQPLRKSLTKVESASPATPPTPATGVSSSNPWSQSESSSPETSGQPADVKPTELIKSKPLPPVPSWQGTSSPHIDRRATIEKRIGRIYESLCKPEFVSSASKIDGANEAIERLKWSLDEIDSELEKVPAISVAMLGPSRHGKSTLLNALAGCTMLPTSDVKPCTASIVSMKREDQWGFTIKFIEKERLEREREKAVQDALDYLKRTAKKMMGDEQPDDPHYLHSTLERFIQLFDINPNLAPDQLIRAVYTAEIPDSVCRLLGQTAKPKSNDVQQMERTVEKYLSTKDIYWTIVDECEISGPFPNWHPNLRLVDVPGTNDTDPQRTAITNRLRETAKAVAICTSDSNLGSDIQSWLRNSSVLGDFLEATEQSKQHLFIIKTKLDAVHPNFDESQAAPDDEEAQERLFREALELHKQQQTESYREMFRRIASPLLPAGNSPEQQNTRKEMLKRIDGIKVFFVSAPAYEAFEGRFKGLVRQKRHFINHFNGDKNATGIPGLGDFTNELAEKYLADFYYNDLERQLETEVDRLVRFFRQQWTTLEAQLSGGSQAIAELVDEIDRTIVPWLEKSVAKGIRSFKDQAVDSSQGITSQLKNTAASIDGLLSQRQSKWRSYYWNSIKAACRKSGVHTTSNGKFMDFNQDICSLFVDDLILSWTTYRETCIRSSTQTIADDVAAELLVKLDSAASRTDVPAATEAIDSIVTNISTIARSKLDELRREVDVAIQEVESIRKPAYKAIQELMEQTYRVVARESGTGCQERMRTKLCDGAGANLQAMWTKVFGMISGAVGGLESKTVASMKQYGDSASGELRKSVSRLREIGKTAQRDVIVEQMERIRETVLLLWNALSEVGDLVVETAESEIIDAATADALEAPVDAVAAGAAEADATPEVHEPERIEKSQEESELPTVEGPIDSDDAPEQAVESAIETTLDPVDESPAEAIDIAGSSDSVHGLEDLCETTTYLVQKDRAGRSAPADELVVRILTTLIEHHGKMTLAALAERIGVPAFRLRGMLPAVQRILNLDGQQILKTERTSDSVELNETLMRQEFSL